MAKTDLAIGILIEGKTEDELPEQILGACSMTRANVLKCALVEGRVRGSTE
jgi:hypothetical protein